MSGRTKEFFAYVIPSVLAFALSGVYTMSTDFLSARASVTSALPPSRSATL